MGTAVFLPSPGRTDADPHGTNADTDVKAGCVVIVRASAVGEVVSRRIGRTRADSHTIRRPVTGDTIRRPVTGDTIRRPVTGDTIRRPVTGDTIRRPVTIERTAAIADIIAGGIGVESPRVRVLCGDAASDVYPSIAIGQTIAAPSAVITTFSRHGFPPLAARAAT
jgi:hypothetical protein